LLDPVANYCTAIFITELYIPVNYYTMGVLYFFQGIDQNKITMFWLIIRIESDCILAMFTCVSHAVVLFNRSSLTSDFIAMLFVLFKNSIIGMCLCEFVSVRICFAW